MGQQALDQPWLQADADILRGPLDRLTKRHATQRSNLQPLARGDRPEGGDDEVRVEIGAHCDQQRAVVALAQLAQRRDETALVLALGLAEELLELIDY